MITTSAYTVLEMKDSVPSPREFAAVTLTLIDWPYSKLNGALRNVYMGTLHVRVAITVES